MKAFVKKEKSWVEEDDLEALLYEDRKCVFAESIEEAVDIVNIDMNEHGPEFLVASLDEYGYNKKTEFIIHKTPKLRPMSFFAFVEVLKRTGKKVRVDYKDAGNWKGEIGDKEFADFGILQSGYHYTYDPVGAKKRQEKMHVFIKPRKRRPHYIRDWEISSVKYAVKNELDSQFWKHYRINCKHVNLRTYNPYSANNKIALCTQFLEYIDTFSLFFGKLSYRRIDGFQNFKETWKKQKPKSAEKTYVTKDFFDFWQKESKKYKPRNMGQFKGKKSIKVIQDG